MDINYLTSIAANSGGTLYIMALLLLAALTVIVERTWYLYRTLSGGKQVNERIAKLPRLRTDLLAKEVEHASHLPHAGLIEMVLAHPEQNEREMLADRLEETILHEVPKLDRSLWILDTVVTLAPLLGLFGTIIGMFNAFSGLGQGSAVPTQVTGGVAEALVATASGLFIAMTGLVFLNNLNNRVRLMVHQLETLKQILINRYAQPCNQSGNRTDAPSIALARTGS
ncbi:MAG: MotA/TolQ/ExbB proton channel family protein [Sulfuriferula sp.]|nr:MotA/TolQ/ExbB proton channel family protein [Sulfuriferula sp.]